MTEWWAWMDVSDCRARFSTCICRTQSGFLVSSILVGNTKEKHRAEM